MTWWQILLIILQVIMSGCIYDVLRSIERENWKDQIMFWACVLVPWAFLIWAIGELVWDEARRWWRRRK